MKIRILLTAASVIFFLAAPQVAPAQSTTNKVLTESDQSARMGMYYAVMCELTSADGQTEQARTYAEKALSLLEKPGNDFEFYAKGVAYEKLGNYDLALVNFEQAIQHDPQNLIAYIRRGRVYYQKGNFDRALADFDKAIQLKATKSADEQSKSAPNKEVSGPPTTDIHELIQRDPRPWFDYFKPEAAYLDRGKTYLQKDDNDRAIADFSNAIKLNPAGASAYNHRGVAYASKGELDLALADFDKAIQLDPLLRNAHYNRGLAFSRKGDEDRARADFEKEKQLYPGDKSSAGNQKISPPNILNKRALKLVQPRYTALARMGHASGTVVVEVVVDEEGKVITAHAVSGHPLLWGASVEAAKNSLFSPTLSDGKPARVSGVIQYNFIAQGGSNVDPAPSGTAEPAEKDADGCVEDCAKASSKSLAGGVLNGRAVKLVKPEYPGAARRTHASGLVVVRVLIDEQGKVIAANAVSGDPLLQDVCVAAAKNSLFTPTKLSGQPVKVTGVIHYNFVAQ